MGLLKFIFGDMQATDMQAIDATDGTRPYIRRIKFDIWKFQFLFLMNQVQ